ncbi:hypothetical protein GCM10009849_25820 [Sinomonas flava]|uniref:Uncharacterized protein n=1 Tax=Sinomonas flava TaxID=496857 RepID=A0ABP5NPK3_9MICC
MWESGSRPSQRLWITVWISRVDRGAQGPAWRSPTGYFGVATQSRAPPWTWRGDHGRATRVASEAEAWDLYPNPLQKRVREAK